MGKLLLDSLEIKGFRGFHDLKIERLGRVNLIVGKNSIGKTSLLEALRLYVDGGDPAVVRELLEERNEDRTSTPRRRSSAEKSLFDVKYLFYGRKDLNYPETPRPISIGPLHSPERTLSIALIWGLTRDQIMEEGNGHRESPKSGDDELSGAWVPGYGIQLGNAPRMVFPLDRPSPFYRGWAVTSEIRDVSGISLPANRLDTGFSDLWDEAVLRNREEDVLKSLSIIMPQVERLNFVGEPSPDQDRFPVVKLEGLDNPVPLRSLGGGMNRVLGIALALVNSENGLCLIDEIDSGLHYSVQLDLWRLIFQVAQRLNVQVFATTHSWDCIEAFQKVAVEDQREEGMLIRLQEKQGEIVATLFDERELAIAAREQIEVR